jgi:Cu2+-exporting ATPase
LPVHNLQAFRGDIAGQPRFFCCPACKTVAETIHNLGLGQYYRQRDNKPQQPATVAQHSSAEDFSDVDIAENSAQFVRDTSNDLSEAQLFIPDIHCASCCWLIEQHLSHLPGVQNAQTQLNNHKLTVCWKKETLKPSAVFSALAQIGYRALPWQPTQQQQYSDQQQQQLLRRLGVAGLLAMQIHMIAMGDYFGADAQTQGWLNIVSLLLSLPVWFYCADPFFHSARRNLKNIWHGLRSHSRELLTASMDIPVALAIISAAIASIIAVTQKTDDLYFDSIAMFVFLLLGARFLEAKARAKLAAQAQEPQLPHSCTRVSTDGTQERIAISALKNGELVFAGKGIIPVDGVVIQGTATVEQSAITGEFMPVNKAEGDQVLAGTVLIQGELQLRTIAWGQHCHIALLHQRMEQALQRKHHRNIYDHIAQWFTPMVLLIASSSALFWLWRDASIALPAFLAVLVASCPCALSIAIPAALTAATLQLRQQGILVTGSHVLHLLPSLRAIAFDKTGTLTQGRMQVLRTEIFSNLTVDDSLAIAQALEYGSTHPIASAFAKIDTGKKYKAEDVQHTVHCGIEGTLNGKRYRIGKLAWCIDDASIAPINEQANITIALAVELQLLAIFTLGDELRDDALECVQALQRQPTHCEIISGDHSQAVDAIAQRLNIIDVHKNCSPAGKVAQIEAMKRQFGAIAMVGDGINDGPVLAHADISLALAEASHTAQLAADVVLLNNRLSDVLILQQVALRTQRIARQNLAWALVYNISILPLAATGLLSPVIAALGMALSSLVVTLNALRLFTKKQTSHKK